MKLALAAKLSPMLYWISVFEPAASCKSHGLPFAYNKLLVRKLPTFAVSVTFKLPETFTKFAVARLPKLALLNWELPRTVSSWVVSLYVILAESVNIPLVPANVTLVDVNALNVSWQQLHYQ